MAVKKNETISLVNPQNCSSANEQRFLHTWISPFSEISHVACFHTTMKYTYYKYTRFYEVRHVNQVKPGML